MYAIAFAKQLCGEVHIYGYGNGTGHGSGCPSQCYHVRRLHPQGLIKLHESIALSLQHCNL